MRGWIVVCKSTEYVGFAQLGLCMLASRVFEDKFNYYEPRYKNGTAFMNVALEMWQRSWLLEEPQVVIHNLNLISTLKRECYKEGVNSRKCCFSKVRYSNNLLKWFESSFYVFYIPIQCIWNFLWKILMVFSGKVTWSPSNRLISTNKFHMHILNWINVEMSHCITINSNSLNHKHPQLLRILIALIICVAPLSIGQYGSIH